MRVYFVGVASAAVLVLAGCTSQAAAVPVSKEPPRATLKGPSGLEREQEVRAAQRSAFRALEVAQAERYRIEAERVEAERIEGARVEAERVAAAAAKKAKVAKAAEAAELERQRDETRWHEEVYGEDGKRPCAEVAMEFGHFNPSCPDYQGYLDPRPEYSKEQTEPGDRPWTEAQCVEARQGDWVAHCQAWRLS